MAVSLLSPRAHIQNLSEAAALEPHWGYADRSVPCTNDPGSCRYLDVVYRSHDLGMYYTGILWVTIIAILLIWGIGRQFLRSQPSGLQLPVQPIEGDKTSKSAFERLQHAVPSYIRRYLLPDAARPIFGRTTRVQVLVLVALTAYLTLWSFIGISYGKWVTPVKNKPGVYNTRTSLGPWSDRVGVLAYALTPLSIMLSSRESVLSLVTGLPYQSFNFLHRWLGYIIFAQSALHTIGWCVIEIRLYQPQPTVGLEWIVQPYMIWGVVAMLLLTIMVILSTPWGIRMTGYEFFRKFHYVVAMVYIGACWAHWKELYCFLLPSLILWGIDRGIRLARTALLHYNFLPSGHMGFRSATANITFFPDSQSGDVVRLDWDHPHDAWEIGQHFYLCFPESSVWQSHPFTPLSLPIPGTTNQKHSYIFRAKKGETRKIAELSARRTARNPSEKIDAASSSADARLSTIITGPYGERITQDLSSDANILCIAGGTGITYVLPVLLDLAARPLIRDRRVSLVWVVRHKNDLNWVSPELEVLKRQSRSLGLSISIYVTRAAEQVSSTSATTTTTGEATETPDDTKDPEKSTQTKEITPAIASPSSSSSSSAASSISSTLSMHGISKADLTLSHVTNRPNLHEIVTSFVEANVTGPTEVFASGPGGMISDLRAIVAGVNQPGRVWRGESRGDVRLCCDDRLEW